MINPQKRFHKDVNDDAQFGVDPDEFTADAPSEASGPKAALSYHKMKKWSITI